MTTMIVIGFGDGGERAAEIAEDVNDLTNIYIYSFSIN